MTTTKKDQRWAILPPREPSQGDTTRTHRRVRQNGSGEQAERHPSDEQASGLAEPKELAAVSRRRARTEPELPALDDLVSEVAQAISTPRPPAFEPLRSGQLDSPIREAATAPPEALPTLASPALATSTEGTSLVPVPTLIDRLLPSDEAHEATILERSRVVGPSGLAPSGDSGETLPSPPLQDEER